MPKTRFLRKSLSVFAATFALAFCVESRSQSMSSNKQTPSYSVVGNSISVAGMRITYQSPEAVQFSKRAFSEIWNMGRHIEWRRRQVIF